MTETILGWPSANMEHGRGGVYEQHCSRPPGGNLDVSTVIVIICPGVQLVAGRDGDSSNFVDTDADIICAEMFCHKLGDSWSQNVFDANKKWLHKKGQEAFCAWHRYTALTLVKKTVLCSTVRMAQRRAKAIVFRVK